MMTDYVETGEDKALGRVAKLEALMKYRNGKYQELLAENKELTKQRDDLELILAQLRYYFMDDPFYQVAVKNGWF